MDSRVAWWSSKLDRKANAWFGPPVGRWAGQILRKLTNACKARRAGRATPLKDLGIPPKYRARALRLLMRFDLVNVRPGHPTTITLNSSALARSKNAARASRTPIPAAERRRIKQRDQFACGYCGRRFLEKELEVDHLIPLSFGGADEPGNWVSLCRVHNRAKLDAFHRQGLRFYRGRRVRKSIGVRSRNGFLWPVVNGRICRETRGGNSGDRRRDSS